MKITFSKGLRGSCTASSNKIYDTTTSGVLVRLSDSKFNNGIMISEGTDNNIIIRILKDTKVNIICST